MQRSLPRLIYDVSLLTRLLKATLEDEEDEGLREREILILELLEGRGPMSISDIGGHFPRKASSTISSDISRLWKLETGSDEGLVDKSISKESERERLITLTETGRRKLHDIKAIRSKTHAALIKWLGLDEEEEEVLTRVLERTVQKMEQAIKNPSNGKEHT